MAKAQKATTEQELKAARQRIAELEEEKNAYGVSLTQSKLRERLLETKLAKEQKDHKKIKTALAVALNQQKAIKDFRTGQAQVLLTTVQLLEETLKGYADPDSWAPSDSSNPDFRDRYIGRRLEETVLEDGSLNAASVAAQGWETAQEALNHELLQVG